MPQIRAFGKVIGIRSPRKEASALRELAEFGFATAKALSAKGDYLDSELYWNRAADLDDAACNAEQDKRCFYIRQDTWTAPALNVRGS